MMRRPPFDTTGFLLWFVCVAAAVMGTLLWCTGCVTVEKILDAEGAQRIGEAVTKGVTDFVERLIPEPVEGGVSTELQGIIVLGLGYALNQGRKWWARRNASSP